MDIETPRTDLPWMGSGGGSRRDILETHRDRIKRGVTFSDESKTDFESADYVSSYKRIYPSRENGDVSVIRSEKDKKPGMKTRTTHPDSPRSNKRLVDSQTTDKPIRLPRIVVRDTFGRKLDTFTTLQEAIYRAQWNVRSTCTSHTPREWRLPKAPLPSRPDYSRQGPNVFKKATEQDRSPRVSRPVPPGSVVEIGVEDVSYVAECLRHLPKLETIHDLFHNIGGGHERVYFHIVARLLLHQKVYPSDDRREAVYEFPGFCSGCRRAGFCYACSKGGTNFHIHHDHAARTGGGFTYWKRDRPDHPDATKHPGHWETKIPESELRLLLGTDKSMSGAARDALKKRLILQYPWLQDKLSDGMSIDRMKEMGLVLTAADLGAMEDVEDPEMEGYGQGGLYDDLYSDILGYNRMEKFLQARDAVKRKYTVKLARKPAPVLKVEETYTKDSFESQATESRSRRDGERLGAWDSDVMYNTTDIADSDKDYEDKDNVDGDSKRERLYKPPKVFKLKKKQQRGTTSRSPFSNNRQYDIPKGRPMEVKKSDRSATKFVDFDRSGSSWKEPKRFELSASNKKGTKFWQPTSGGGDGRGKGRPRGDQEEAYLSALERKRRELDRSLSPDSGLDSELVTESVKESISDNDTNRELTSLLNTETDQELSGLNQDHQYDSGKEASGSESPGDHLSPVTSVKKKRSAIIKKTRSPIQYSQKPSPEVTPEPHSEKTLVDDVTPEPPSRERSMTPPTEDLYLPDINLPDLPQYRKEHKEQEKKSKLQKFFVEAPPQLKTPPKKRKSPPKVRKLPKMQYKRKSKPAEAPVTNETLQDVNDPLDFLAKYCIINPNRLPFYEIIFENMVGEQTPRYERQQSASEQLTVNEREVTEVKVKGKGKKSGKKSEDEISEHELKLARDMLLINHRHIITDKIGLSPPEEYLEKITYTLKTLQDKAVTMQKQLTELDVKRISVLAEETRKQFPDVCTYDYVAPDKKKGKKGKKSKKDQDTLDVTPRRRGEPVPDYVIVDRLTDAQITTLSEEAEVRQLNLERERTQEKMQDVHSRIQQLEGEKLLFDVLCSDNFFNDQTENQRPSGFRRQQSQLYNKLHPDPDYELELETVEEALQQINNHLLTDQEFKYLYFILNLPGRSRINFRLFSVIAALSEKVTQMDPVIRDLLNKFDYNALDVKMEKCKDLFSLLEDDQMTTPNGGAPASNLVLELTAGGLKPEHTSYVLSKFNREGKGAFDFMDFVTYIPLFIEIHQRIIKDPLCEEHDL